jgi:catechol 2,3-dioxygenase-like lactoylglutathione lyase family enzyme
MTTLLRVARNVANLNTAVQFYEKLGFHLIAGAADNPALAARLGLTRIRSQLLQRGAQRLELSQAFPAPAANPVPQAANDLGFQHIALVTPDIRSATAAALQAGATPISTGGPQKLPASSGGVTAWKFRDPEGHPLEFLQFPDPAKNADPGYDHTAITVANLATSIAFYAALGFTETSAQRNQGPEQDRLDGLQVAIVDVIALQAQNTTPHLELLHYRTPIGRRTPSATRTILTGPPPRLTQDPDGHVVLVE